MRAAKVEVLPARQNDPLLERGRVEKTFQGLGMFMAAVLLLCGGYLLLKAFLEPLEATEMTVLGAGFTLALATFAITYLLWPRRRSPHLRDELRAQPQEDSNAPFPASYETASQTRINARRLLTEGKDLPGPM